MKHPLINEDSSSHYLMADGVEAIERLEMMFTQEELMAWAKITAMKYRLRIGHKDAPEKEVKKIKTYEDYHAFLVANRDGIKLDDELEFTDEEEVMMAKFTEGQNELLVTTLKAKHGECIGVPDGVSVVEALEVYKEAQKCLNR